MKPVVMSKNLVQVCLCKKVGKCMKNLIIINGTMGVGKTTTSKILLKLLPNCVFLDGDWCWYADPWIVTDETKNMVDQNISFLLNNFLSCSAYENVIFCWVMHDENLIDRVLSWVKGSKYSLHKYSLVCSEDALVTRLKKDIADSMRNDDIIERSLKRLPNFVKMDTVKIDVSEITPKQAAHIIYELVMQTQR